MKKSFTIKQPKLLLFLLLLVTMLVTRCQQDVLTTDLDQELLAAMNLASPTGHADYYVLANPTKTASLPNQDPHNPITPAKIKLGQMIFFDPGVGQLPVHQDSYETYSCSTCHIPAAGFLPGRAQGIADGATGFGILGSYRSQLPDYQESELDAQGVRPLSIMNVTYVTNTLWSGLFGAQHVNTGTEENWVGDLAKVNHLGYEGLESQNIEGMVLHRMEINERVLSTHGYRAYFDLAFPDVPENERYNYKTASFALGSYLRTVVTNEAPFQDYLKGNTDAITNQQKQGALLFFSKARCYTCHNAPSFSNMEFHALGTADMYQFGGLNTSVDDPRNLGRGLFTGKEVDYYRFKVPQLYNLKDYRTFFHGSSKATLSDVIDFKIKAQSENPHVSQDRLSPRFRPIDLSAAEKDALIDFLTNALYDPYMSRYVPEKTQSGACFPNNDELSRYQMGCN
ncbi:MAG TPA: cytochrome c peroxidase [Saprospiraceae bacterium]|nr:hypothetical protein [Saprospiraceae bacterium]HPG09211.1 cytochrome c peroxidase [Saprospiraceae bacterium]HPQ98563.1 cytochrome c peroxidase [Saprospiraceae bacterium]HRV85944.1 cytochrome c peroxidase [Saprospiraceae bacterium]